MVGGYPDIACAIVLQATDRVGHIGACFWQQNCTPLPTFVVIHLIADGRIGPQHTTMVHIANGGLIIVERERRMSSQGINLLRSRMILAELFRRHETITLTNKDNRLATPFYPDVALGIFL